MREIEFRAWLKNKKKIVKVKAIDFIEEEIRVGGNWYSFEDVELIEYTNLKDKNGVKIFEGDIVKANGYIYEVIYWKEEAKYHLTSDYYDSDCSFGDVGNAFIKGNNGEYKDLEVIGNIYENKELLNE